MIFFNIKQEDFDNLLELKKKADYKFLLAIKYNLTLSNSTIKKVKKNTIEYINSQKKLLEKLNEMIFKWLLIFLLSFYKKQKKHKK